jgi:hypothetical protein
MNEMRLLEIEREFNNLSDENVINFVNILIEDTYDSYRDLFKEKTLNRLDNLYHGKTMKGNFLYILAVIAGLVTAQPIITQEEIDEWNNVE